MRGVKTNNQSFEASPILKEPLVNAKAKDVSTPHNQQITFRSLAELGRTRGAGGVRPISTHTKKKNRVSKCIKSPKYSFKATCFFHMGGSDT